MSSGFDWDNLKRKYLYGDIRSVNAFLDTEEISVNGFVTRKTKHWRDEKEIFEQEVDKTTKAKLIELLSDDLADVQKRQAAITKHMQEMALKALEKHQPNNFSEALKCLQIALHEEREALGLNNNQKHEVYIEPPIMRTRYAQPLKGMSNQELAEVLQHLSDSKNDTIVN